MKFIMLKAWRFAHVHEKNQSVRTFFSQSLKKYEPCKKDMRELIKNLVEKIVCAS